MDNFNGYQQYQQQVVQPNMYYQPTQTQPIYNQRNWQQYYQAPQPTTAVPQYQMSPQSMNPGMIWVQGEAGAKAYTLPNNTTLPLWDSEAQVIYIKSVDNNGKPTMTILDYVDRNAPNTQEEKTQIEYATKDQVDQISEQLSSFNKKLGDFENYVTRDQLGAVSDQLENLNNQIEDIENRIMVFSKPQQNVNNKRSGGGK